MIPIEKHCVHKPGECAGWPNIAKMRPPGKASITYFRVVDPSTLECIPYKDYPKYEDDQVDNAKPVGKKKHP